MKEACRAGGLVLILAVQLIAFLTGDDLRALIALLAIGAFVWVAAYLSAPDQNQNLLVAALVFAASTPVLAVVGHKDVAWAVLPCGALLVLAAELLDVASRIAPETESDSRMRLVGDRLNASLIAAAPVALVAVGMLVFATLR